MTDYSIVISDEKIKELIEIALDKELIEFNMSSNFYEEYEMDSLGAVALLVETQKTFKIKIQENEMPNILTGNDLKNIIISKIKAKSDE